MKILVLAGIVLAALLPMPAAKQENRKVGSGAISGSVLDAISKTPIEGARVRVIGAISGSPDVLTDSRGRFVFEDLTKGVFRVEAAANSFLPARFTIGTPTASGTQISLASGEWFQGANVLLEPASSISGHIVDESGRPLSGASVQLVSEVTIAQRRRLALGPSTLADREGFYSLGPLVSGSYRVLVVSTQHSVAVDADPATVAGLEPSVYEKRSAILTRPNLSAIVVGDTALIASSALMPTQRAGGPIRIYPPTFYPSARDLSSTPAFYLAPGAKKEDVDVRLAPIVGFGLSGRIVGAAAWPSGLVVRLVSPDLMDLGDAGDVATSLIEKDGSFRFPSVPPGEYDLLASPIKSGFTFHRDSSAPAMRPTPGFVQIDSGGYALSGILDGLAYSFAVGSAPYFGRVAVHIGDRPVAGIDLSVSMVPALQLLVSTEGQLPRPPRVRVTFEPANGIGQPAGASAEVEEDGRATVNGVEPGEYVLRCVNFVKAVRIAGMDTFGRPFRIPDARGPIEIELGETATLLTGTVTGSDPTAGAYVIAYPTDETKWMNYGYFNQLVSTTQATTSGSFSLTIRDRDDYFLIAVSASQRNVWLDAQFLRAARIHSARFDKINTDRSAVQVPLWSGWHR